MTGIEPRRTGEIMPERDFLDEMIERRTARNPEFPRLLDAAQRRRELLRALAGQREGQKRSQTAIAAAMETSQSFVARLESTAADAKISTIDRYADSLGFVVQYHLIPAADADGAPPVVVESSSKQ
jgi:hypothetical protein